MIGETVGNFRIISLLGRGGMGEVYLAEHTSIETRVAIKFLLKDVSEDEAVVHRFFNEARAVGRIKHAGICRIFDVGFYKGFAYLIMEFLEGESLGDRLRRVGKLGVTELCDIARQIASVLEATHNVGIIHRDLKPDNIVLVHDHEMASGERVKILDFGIAKLGGAVSKKGPRTEGAMGTPTYMAPEQWGNSASVDWRADAYALGVVAYEMASGVPPFDAETIAEFYAKHLNEPPPPLHLHGVEVPPTLEDLIQALLAKAPDARPQSMRAVTRGFEAQLNAAWVRGPQDVTIRPEASLLARAHLAEDGRASGSAKAIPAEPTPRPSDLVQTDPRPNPTGERRKIAGTSDTTLNNAASQTQGDDFERPKNPLTVPALLITAIVVVVIACIVVVVQRDKGKKSAAASGQGSAQTEPAAADAAVASVDAPVPFGDWLAAANPYVASGALKVMQHQVTRAEYAAFLAQLPDDKARTKATPRTDWGLGDPGTPVAWLTFEQAKAFCEAIGGRLPTSDEWTKLSGKKWGLDPASTGRIGPLREWTSTVRGDFATVRGGHDRMAPSARDKAATEPLDILTEAAAGPNAPLETIANATTGIRCVR